MTSRPCAVTTSICARKMTRSWLLVRSRRPGPLSNFRDRWSVRDGIVVIDRQVKVDGDAPGGFLTALLVTLANPTDPRVFLPGMQYGDPARVNPDAIGSQRYLDEGLREFRIREDRLPWSPCGPTPAPP